METNDVPPPRGSTRLAAGLLAIFLGTLGIHKFYIGKPLWGFVYILLAPTFLSTLLGFFEGLWFLSMTDAEFARRYG